MYHFFVEANQIDTDAHKVLISGSDYNHIRNVLRMHPGEEISVSCISGGAGFGAGSTGAADGAADATPDKNEYRCEIAEFTDDAVLCNLLFVKEADVESPVYSVLYQGIPKGDKMETIVQKCVELGVSEIVPVSCSRCVVKLDEKKAAAKVARWQGIAEAAAKQSKRAVIPKVGMPLSMKAAVSQAKDADFKMIPYELAEGAEQTREIFESLRTAAAQTSDARRTLAIFIGPEGGFTEEEIALAEDAGFTPVTLGHRILRTETAGLVVLAWIVYNVES